MKQQRDSRLYRHAIFDFDGVICDSLSSAIKAYNELRESEFPDLPVVNDRRDMSHVYSGSLSTCLHRWLSPEESKRFFDLHSARMADVMPTLGTFPGICHVLNRVGRKAASIVTSAYSQAVREILGRDPSFVPDCLFTVAGRELRQTKTLKIQNLVSSLGLKPNEAIYVGDLESDVMYCKNVPIEIIAVSYGYQERDVLVESSPEYVVDSVGALGNLLSKLMKRERK